MTQHAHYKKDISHLKTLDIYRVLDLFGVTNPAIQHAVKKLLCAGQRGAKDYERDLREAVDSINRALQMVAEDCNKGQRGYPERVAGALDGWIEWSGGECPVEAGQTVEVTFRDGGRKSATLHKPRKGWEHQGNDDDIIAYRIVEAQ